MTSRKPAPGKHRAELGSASFCLEGRSLTSRPTVRKRDQRESNPLLLPGKQACYQEHLDLTRARDGTRIRVIFLGKEAPNLSATLAIRGRSENRTRDCNFADCQLTTCRSGHRGEQWSRSTCHSWHRRFSKPRRSPIVLLSKEAEGGSHDLHAQLGTHCFRDRPGPRPIHLPWRRTEGTIPRPEGPIRFQDGARSIPGSSSNEESGLLESQALRLAPASNRAVDLPRSLSMGRQPGTRTLQNRFWRPIRALRVAQKVDLA